MRHGFASCDMEKLSPDDDRGWCRHFGRGCEGSGGPEGVAILLNAGTFTHGADLCDRDAVGNYGGALFGGAITSICSIARRGVGGWRPHSTLSDGAAGQGGLRRSPRVHLVLHRLHWSAGFNDTFLAPISRRCIEIRAPELLRGLL